MVPAWRMELKSIGAGSVVTWLKGREGGKENKITTNERSPENSQEPERKKADTKQQIYTESRIKRRLDEEGNRIAVEGSGRSQ